MSFISLYGIIVDLIFTSAMYLAVKGISENNKSTKIGTQILSGFIFGFLLIATILLWNIGPGIYNIQWFNK